jgi:2-polyprenyl-3-methyl-5-hydroxy-6-metoxy-1,4-benzoquinol methylase
MDHNSQAVSVFNTLAEVYQEKYMSVDLYRELIDLFCSEIPSDGKILDVACGPGNMLKYIHEHYPQKFQLSGVDLAGSMIELAKANVPSATFWQEDCRELGKEKRKYDGVICSFCVPYLNKEETIHLVKDISSILQGVLLFSFISGDQTDSGFVASSRGDNVWNHYYERDFIMECLHECGLKITAVQEFTSPNTSQKQKDVMLVASNKVTL